MRRVPMLGQLRALGVVAEAGPHELLQMLGLRAAAALRLAALEQRRLRLAPAARCSLWLHPQACRGRSSARRV